MTKAEWLDKNGFSEDGFTFCVIGEDTYSIKDWLKSMGYKFSPLLKWHGGFPLELSEDFKLVYFTFDELYQWDAVNQNAYFYENAETLINRRFKEVQGPSLSEYIGEVGQRLRDMTAIYKSSRGFSGAYGWTNIHTFQIGEDVLVWFTAKDLNLEKGQPILLTGTIKKHEEFREVKTTQLSRCIIKEVK